jgi:hypothetical protein
LPPKVQGEWGGAVYDQYGFYTSYSGAGGRLGDAGLKMRILGRAASDQVAGQCFATASRTGVSTSAGAFLM